MKVQVGDEGLVTLANTSFAAPGGEGAVYHFDPPRDTIVKLYKDTQTDKIVRACDPSLTEKLEVMIDTPPDFLPRDAVSWPLALVRSRAGHVIGYQMDAMPGKSLAWYINEQNRVDINCRFNYSDMVMVAIELCEVIESLHQHDIIIADINHNNIFVENSGDGNPGRIHLIDTDSFQLQNPYSGDYYLCDLNAPGFRPPDHISGKKREPHHDNYCLAIILFALLMEGEHPTGGTIKGTTPYSREELMVKGLFPYAGRGLAVIDPPPSPPAVSWRSLPQSIQDYFIQCFHTAYREPVKRPTAEDWAKVLTQELKGMRQCAQDPWHHYFGHNSQCSWCTKGTQKQSKRSLLNSPRRRKAARTMPVGRPVTPPLRVSYSRMPPYFQAAVSVIAILGFLIWAVAPLRNTLVAASVTPPQQYAAAVSTYQEKLKAAISEPNITPSPTPPPPPAPAKIEIIRTRWKDNNNRLPDAGEKGTLHVWIQNTGTVSAELYPPTLIQRGGGSGWKIASTYNIAKTTLEPGEFLEITWNASINQVEAGELNLPPYQLEVRDTFSRTVAKGPISFL